MAKRWQVWACALVMTGCGARSSITTPSNDFAIAAGNARIQIDLDDSLHADRARLRDWLDDGVRAVTIYYGRFPVDQLVIRIDGDVRVGVNGGKTFGYPAPLIRMTVGAGTPAPRLRRDWMLVHELVHLTFPGVPDEQLWAHEGLATYVEPLARHQAGQLAARQVWGDLVEGLPKGTRELTRAGLDENGSWGCTYWGGAFFWLMADMQIRQRTSMQKGLPDALRAILAKGGNNQVMWPLRDTLRHGDNAVGVEVLVPLYDHMRATPQNIDLHGLWRQLGVTTSAGGMQFDDTAPLAAVRKAIAAD